jgi:hypothetical protein
VTRLLTPTPEAKGEIAIDSVDENQTLRQFLGKANEPTPGELLGFVAQVRRTSEHTSKGECSLRWTVLDAAGPRPVSDTSLVNQPPNRIDGDPTACNGEADIWIPMKPTLGAYGAVKLRFVLWHGDTKLDSTDSDAMTLG